MKLLIVKLHAVGDLVIATPALRRIRDGLPDAHIDLLTSRWTEPAIRYNPCVDKVIVVDDDVFLHPQPSAAHKLARLWLELVRGRYDAAVLFHRHRAVELFIRMVGISPRFRFGWERTTNTVLLNENRHSALTAWELADLAVTSLGGSVQSHPRLADLRYEWHISEDESRVAEHILQARGLKDRSFAAIFPGGGVIPSYNEAVRRWKPQKFAELSERLSSEYGLTPVLLGGRNDIEIGEIVGRLASVMLVDLTGKLDLRIAAACAARARLAVGNDSGPLHIAAAVGTPVVGIFGPTGVRYKLPPSKAFAATLGLPCSPCYFTKFAGCIFPGIRCMEELQIDTVMQAVGKARQAGSSWG